VLVCFTLYAVIPNLFQTLDSVRRNPRFLLETRPRTAMITTAALGEDVDAGRAERVGQRIRKRHVTEPTGVFFDKVVRVDPSDPDSPKIGQGRFHAEIWLLSWFGIDFTRCGKAQLVATRFFVDALLPFVLLFVLSGVTRPVAQHDLNRFFAKMHTPVQPTPEDEQRALAQAIERPDLQEGKKLRPGSSWEILKPGWIDLIGFGGSWVLVGVVVLLLYLLVTIGR
jgi:SSS family solute:Na+ symporter